jgi:O-antigen/teichoic acid export membrane protein
MSLKKNIGYNSLLTLSNYIIPIIVFPYVSRILGVKNFGVFSFIDSILNYYVLFSMLGITTLGIREISKSKFNFQERNNVFSNLFVLNLISTTIVLVLFFASIFFIPKFFLYRNLLYIGSAKILFNLFLIEWFYIGINNFKYITIRTIIIRVLFIISIFLFVNDQNDYDIYLVLTVLTVVLNASLNWLFSKKLVIFKFTKFNLKPYVKPFFQLGAYSLLTSMYTSFNLIYLGFIAGQTEVGYFATAIKIQSILLSLFGAFSNVMMPHISTLISEDKIGEVKKLISKSFEALYAFSIPLIFICIMLAPQIIEIVSGEDYEGSVLPMKIVMPLILIIGLEQVLIIQILIPLQKDREILINSILGASVGVLLNILLVSFFKSVGSSIVWLLSEIAVLLSAMFFVYKSIKINIMFSQLLKNIIFGLPYLLFCWMSLMYFKSNLLIISVAGLLSLIYFVISQIWLIKNSALILFINRIR